MTCTSCYISGVLFCFLGLIFLFAAIPTNYWTVDNTIGFHRGILTVCEENGLLGGLSETCYWNHKLESSQTTVLVHEFIEAVLVALSLLFSSILFTLSVCCCGSSRFKQSVGPLMVFGAVCSASGITMYACNHFSNQATLPSGVVRKFDGLKYFGWSFWLSTLGCLCQLISSLIFIVSKCCYDEVGENGQPRKQNKRQKQ